MLKVAYSGCPFTKYAIFVSVSPPFRASAYGEYIEVSNVAVSCIYFSSS